MNTNLIQDRVSREDYTHKEKKLKGFKVISADEMNKPLTKKDKERLFHGTALEWLNLDKKQFI